MVCWVDWKTGTLYRTDKSAQGKNSKLKKKKFKLLAENFDVSPNAKWSCWRKEHNNARPAARGLLGSIPNWYWVQQGVKVPGTAKTELRF